MSEDKYNNEYKEFGERLKRLRCEVELSQKTLANTLGMPQQTYQGYESGIRKVTLKLLQQFAEFFDVSIDFLAGRTTDRTPCNIGKLYDTSNQYKTLNTSEEKRTLRQCVDINEKPTTICDDELNLKKEISLEIKNRYGETTLELVNNFQKLDEIDQNKILERIDVLLENEKYFTKKEYKNA